MTTEDTASAAASLLGLGTWTRQGPATLVVREDRWVVLVTSSVSGDGFRSSLPGRP